MILKPPLCRRVNSISSGGQADMNLYRSFPLRWWTINMNLVKSYHILSHFDHPLFFPGFIGGLVDLKHGEENGRLLFSTVQHICIIKHTNNLLRRVIHVLSDHLCFCYTNSFEGTNCKSHFSLAYQKNTNHRCFLPTACSAPLDHYQNYRQSLNLLYKCTNKIFSECRPSPFHTGYF